MTMMDVGPELKAASDKHRAIEDLHLLIELRSHDLREMCTRLRVLHDERDAAIRHAVRAGASTRQTAEALDLAPSTIFNICVRWDLIRDALHYSGFSPEDE